VKLGFDIEYDQALDGSMRFDAAKYPSASWHARTFVTGKRNVHEAPIPVPRALHPYPMERFKLWKTVLNLGRQDNGFASGEFIISSTFQGCRSAISRAPKPETACFHLVVLSGQPKSLVSAVR
jgi:hypothetical protein